MLLETIFILGTFLTFNSYIKYPLILGIWFYIIFDRIVDWVINSESTDFTSDDPELKDDIEDAVFKLNEYWDCLKACNENINLYNIISIRLNYFRPLKYAYKIIKTIVYPFEWLYKKSEFFKLPHLIKKLDDYYKSCLIMIGLYIYNLSLTQYFIKKLVMTVQKNIFNIINTYSKMNKTFSSKDIKQIKKLNNHIDMNQLDSVIKILQNNPEFNKSMDKILKTINVETTKVSSDNTKTE